MDSPSLAVLKGQVQWGLEQLGLVGGDPAHAEGLKLDNL